MKCFVCPGPFHPATGHLFQEDVAYCGPCFRYFMEWLKNHTRPRRDGLDFYKEAGTSIRA